MSDKQNPNCRKLVDLIKPMGLCQIIKQPTRYSNTKNSILDLCITISINSIFSEVAYVILTLVIIRL